jgi:hypothetical protein
VDPVAWRNEVERLGPKLSKIRIPASSMNPFGDWMTHQDKLRSEGAKLSSEAPSVSTNLAKLAEGIAKDLERWVVHLCYGSALLFMDALKKANKL